VLSAVQIAHCECAITINNFDVFEAARKKEATQTAKNIEIARKKQKI